jgi:hypothetical protein
LSEEYILYADESDQKGKYFSNFYGGALIASKYIEPVNRILNQKKIELNFYGEIKWTKITEIYAEKYIKMMNCFFLENIWLQPYRHWLFMPGNFEHDETLSKRWAKKYPTRTRV